MNKWPGSGYVTSKVNLATSDITHVPKAFQLPGQEAEFRSYVSNTPVYKLVNKMSWQWHKTHSLMTVNGHIPEFISPLYFI